MQINMTDIAWARAELERVIKAGAKLVTLPSVTPPGGVSPAHEDWDHSGRCSRRPMSRRHCTSARWADDSKTPDMLARDNDPMMPDRGWGHAASLKGAPSNRPGGEERSAPISFSSPMPRPRFS